MANRYGTMSKVVAVANRRTPITARARAAFCSSPGPPIAIGIMPTTMAAAVIKTGRISFAWRLRSLDHLVGKGKQRRWKREVERFRRLEIEHQLEFGRLLNRQIAGFCALEDLIDE
jgi:hypothetical protein